MIIHSPRSPVIHCWLHSHSRHCTAAIFKGGLGHFLECFLRARTALGDLTLEYKMKTPQRIIYFQKLMSLFLFIFLNTTIYKQCILLSCLNLRSNLSRQHEVCKMMFTNMYVKGFFLWNYKDSFIVKL